MLPIFKQFIIIKETMPVQMRRERSHDVGKFKVQKSGSYDSLYPMLGDVGRRLF
jgi:hypothetical protein